MASASARPQANTKTPADIGLPNVQSKETLLTEFKYNEMFSKRKVESNWSKYEDLPDEEDNEQLLAANFEEMLLGSKTIGSHFTFSSEKHWDNIEADGSLQQSHGINDRLFKLNLNLLKSGLGGLPFDVRLGYSEDMFNGLELGDIAQRVGCYDRLVKKEVDNDDMDMITRFEKIDAKAANAANATSSDIIVGHKSIEKNISTAKENVVVGQSTPATNASNTSFPISSSKPSPAAVTNETPKPIKPAITVAPQAIEHIQGWLDDILNNG